MIGEEFVNKLNNICISKDTVHRRIADMSADFREQIIEEIKSSPLTIFSIQLDESTEVYARYIHNGDFKDEFLFCKTLETTTTSRDIFEKVGSFLSIQNISWEYICGVCTDGAPSMLGCRSGFQSLNSLYDSSTNISNKNTAT
ncbi:hypothetical protein RF11_15965 [Thelohanellus kitauei]|uniref:Uncharacterized protein n=1 Tax=Thelohanellus kitauei TaxID=669202 RepID=A0A0C2MH82_THEKT|nr:hypothetical protein RF11_15965 [Thelohanellus kitauei]